MAGDHDVERNGQYRYAPFLLYWIERATAKQGEGAEARDCTISNSTRLGTNVSGGGKYVAPAR